MTKAFGGGRIIVESREYMKNKKGFTLIELLAVIVILAIIALIATPMILRVVENARKSAAQSSALGWIDAVEKQMMINAMDSDTTNDIPNRQLTVSDLLTTYHVKVKGSTPSSGTVTIENQKVTGAQLVVNNYNVTCTSSACNVTGKSTGPSITIDKTSLGNEPEINAGDTLQLQASVTNFDNPTITWTSSNTGVASITSGGLVTGLSAGETIITASINNGAIVDSFTLTVVSSDIDVESASISCSVSNNPMDMAACMQSISCEVDSYYPTNATKNMKATIRYNDHDTLIDVENESNYFSDGYDNQGGCGDIIVEIRNDSNTLLDSVECDYDTCN